MSRKNYCPHCSAANPTAEHKRLCLAESNGRTVFECDVEMPRGNSYRKGSDRYEAFMRGYNAAREASCCL